MFLRLSVSSQRFQTRGICEISGRVPVDRRDETRRAVFIKRLISFVEEASAASQLVASRSLGDISIPGPTDSIRGSNQSAFSKDNFAGVYEFKGEPSFRLDRPFRGF